MKIYEITLESTESDSSVYDYEFHLLYMEAIFSHFPSKLRLNLNLKTAILVS